MYNLAKPHVTNVVTNIQAKWVLKISLHLKPIKHLWDILSRELQNLQLLLQSFNGIQRDIVEILNGIGKEQIRRLISST